MWDVTAYLLPCYVDAKIDIAEMILYLKTARTKILNYHYGRENEGTGKMGWVKGKRDKREKH